ncbi:hypothetical protein [Loigolactobacillus backii]|uniref:Uncharacterized protein n=1 Tax=Loigolactobacillus backii TaxID=375175 RepID=A0A192H4B3_9LACO|nr:hypothetical protein [Loigolactobacillus backii]ANK59621.1 hypothetical protein AYR52_04755 [Loigolactobacillus backii]ANK62811.1 hypothetical protein AYR53_08625 [Loigolactobacillus backii]ANK64615.1 hypothetical protein AYR54_04770 [Loigolactobacillus backii]ANK66989.1 hypothetical protein AYR55_04270 [Loigolactobacillus backii]ANK70181.1 hypothetical protein AYR56_08380 [Loigolactobacillus backii]
MTKIKQILLMPVTSYFLISLLLTFILPLISRALHISSVIRIGWGFIIVNGIAAILFGLQVARKKRPAWLILIFPFLFTLAVYFLYGKYAYWFALIYLCLSYLSYGLKKPISVAK